jgi:hypothetical protein
MDNFPGSKLFGVFRSTIGLFGVPEADCAKVGCERNSVAALRRQAETAGKDRCVFALIVFFRSQKTTDDLARFLA